MPIIMYKSVLVHTLWDEWQPFVTNDKIMEDLIEIFDDLAKLVDVTAGNRYSKRDIFYLEF